MEYQQVLEEAKSLISGLTEFKDGVLHFVGEMVSVRVWCRTLRKGRMQVILHFCPQGIRKCSLEGVKIALQKVGERRRFREGTLDRRGQIRFSGIEAEAQYKLRLLTA